VRHAIRQTVAAFFALLLGIMLNIAPVATANPTAASGAFFGGGSGTPANLEYGVMEQIVSPFFTPNPGAQDPFIVETKYTEESGEELHLRLQQAHLETDNGFFGVVTLSAGAAPAHAAQQQMDQNLADGAPTLPAGSVSFYYIGDPDSPEGLKARLLGVQTPTHKETAFATTYVHGQYEMWAHFPTNPLNLLAVANSVMGLPYVHMETGTGSIHDPLKPENLVNAETEEHADYTIVRVHTKVLPLLRPLSDTAHRVAQTDKQHQFVDKVVGKLDTALRPIVDAGYSNNKLGSLLTKSSSRNEDKETGEAVAQKSTASTYKDRPMRSFSKTVHEKAEKAATKFRQSVAEKREERKAERADRREERKIKRDTQRVKREAARKTRAE